MQKGFIGETPSWEQIQSLRVDFKNKYGYIPTTIEITGFGNYSVKLY